MPNGRRLKQYRPKGVMNVVSGEDYGDNGICQNTEFASNLENTLAPAIWARVCSTAVRGCLSQRTFSFNFVRSTQIRTRLFGFGTTTIPAHQSVGDSICEITPSFSILWSSALTLSIKGIATLRGAVRANGTAPSLSWMEFSPALGKAEESTQLASLASRF